MKRPRKKPQRRSKRIVELAPPGPRLHLRLDLGFRNALRKRAELAKQGLAEPDAPISLGRSSSLENYPEENLPQE